MVPFFPRIFEKKIYLRLMQQYWITLFDGIEHEFVSVQSFLSEISFVINEEF